MTMTDKELEQLILDLVSASSRPLAREELAAIADWAEDIILEQALLSSIREGKMQMVVPEALDLTRPIGDQLLYQPSPPK